MEPSSSSQESRSQPRYNLSTPSPQQLKVMATATTTTANASAPTSPRTKSQHQYLQDNSTTLNNPDPSSSTSNLLSSANCKKRPLPKGSSFKNNNTKTLSDTQSKVIVTAPTPSTDTSTTAHRISSRPTFDISEVTHDPENYMFTLRVDSKGTIVALCYLPTRYATLIEFYHTEVPLAYRHMGLGDLVVKRAFEWVEQSNLLVIPSCPFVLRYLKTHYQDTNSGQWKYTVKDELDGLEKLAHRT